METARITEILTDPVTLDLVDKQPIMQIAYVAADGSPRAVPIGYLLRQGTFLFFTIPTSDKVAALHRDPRIALTNDIYPPPCCLLVRGTAELREEDGVPDEYLEASFRTMPEDQHAAFEEQVRALYDSMVRIVVAPTWVRLNDFQRTAPRAVERLIRAKRGLTTKPGRHEDPIRSGRPPTGRRPGRGPPPTDERLSWEPSGLPSGSARCQPVIGVAPCRARPTGPPWRCDGS
jgi:hypothetical protein